MKCTWSLRITEGVKQVIAMGPVASQEAIKLIGTNGGGFRTRTDLIGFTVRY